jgi:hypothetical protein
VLNQNDFMADTNSNPVARIFPHLDVRNNNKTPGNGIIESVNLALIKKAETELP